MKVFPVYRVNPVTRTREHIGVVTERRRSERGSNIVGLHRLARSSYAYALADAHEIVVGDAMDLTDVGPRRGTS